MTQRVHSLVAAAAVIAFASAGWAQVYQKNVPTALGQARDASPQVGSGGLNTGTSIGAYGSFALDSQLYVTGQVTGLARFRGSVPYTAPGQFQIGLPSASLSDFQRRSVGIGDVLSGSTYAPAPYYDPARTILRAPAIVAGLGLPGTNVPANASMINPSVASRLYVNAMAQYQSLLPSSPGRALAVPMQPMPSAVTPYGSAVREGVSAGAAARNREEPPVPGAGVLFDVLLDRERARLGKELYELEHPEWSVKARVRAAVQAEANFPLYPGDPNAYRGTRNVARGTGLESPAAREDLDAFFEFLQRLAQRRDLTGGLPEANAVLPPSGPGAIVELTPGNVIVIHAFAGRGKDLLNRTLADADAKLKTGKFYEAAEAYETAYVQNLRNPVPRLGRALAYFGAGEPVTAGAEVRMALETFPPLMEMHLDIRALMDMNVFTSRLADLDRRLAAAEEGSADPVLSFMACYLHHNAGHQADARRYALMVQSVAGETKTARAYADYVLTGKLPEAATQPASAPTSQPASRPTSKPAPLGSASGPANR